MSFPSFTIHTSLTMLYHSSVMKKGQCVAAVAAMAFVASTEIALHVPQNDAEPMKGLKNALPQHLSPSQPAILAIKS